MWLKNSALLGLSMTRAFGDTLVRANRTKPLQALQTIVNHCKPESSQTIANRSIQSNSFHSVWNSALGQGSPAGIISEPDITAHWLDNESEEGEVDSATATDEQRGRAVFLVLASDGVWDWVSNAEVGALLARCVSWKCTGNRKQQQRSRNELDEAEKPSAKEEAAEEKKSESASESPSESASESESESASESEEVASCGWDVEGVDLEAACAALVNLATARAMESDEMSDDASVVLVNLARR